MHPQERRGCARQQPPHGHARAARSIGFSWRQQQFLSVIRRALVAGSHPEQEVTLYSPFLRESRRKRRKFRPNSWFRKQSLQVKGPARHAPPRPSVPCFCEDLWFFLHSGRPGFFLLGVESCENMRLGRQVVPLTSVVLCPFS